MNELRRSVKASVLLEQDFSFFPSLYKVKFAYYSYLIAE
jgi:hypothetical protein